VQDGGRASKGIARVFKLQNSYSAERNGPTRQVPHYLQNIESKIKGEVDYHKMLHQLSKVEKGRLEEQPSQSVRAGTPRVGHH